MPWRHGMQDAEVEPPEQGNEVYPLAHEQNGKPPGLNGIQWELMGINGVLMGS